MSRYRRAVQPGGTFFFTVVTHGRSPFLCDDAARPVLRAALDDARSRRPFTLEALVLLPDHIHPMFTLPDDDADFSTRLASVKATFTRTWLSTGGIELPQSPSRARHRFRGVWQKRFWEHHVRNPDDFAAHLDYVHYNPVKHGLVTCPHLWPWSTFQKWVARGVYPPDWMCVCDGRTRIPPAFDGLEECELE